MCRPTAPRAWSVRKSGPPQTLWRWQPQHLSVRTRVEEPPTRADRHRSTRGPPSPAARRVRRSQSVPLSRPCKAAWPSLAPADERPRFSAVRSSRLFGGHSVPILILSPFVCSSLSLRRLAESLALQRNWERHQTLGARRIAFYRPRSLPSRDPCRFLHALAS